MGEYKDLKTQHGDKLTVIYSMRENLFGQPTTEGDLAEYEDFVEGIGDIEVVADPDFSIFEIVTGGESGNSGLGATERSMLLSPGVVVDTNVWAFPSYVSQVVGGG